MNFCVVGSSNMDVVTRVRRFPQPGETLAGSSFQIFPGGKGANQAVALAKLGVGVELVSALGNDTLGGSYREVLDAAGVGRRGVQVVEGCSTGTATILVNESAENYIVIVPGANAHVDANAVKTFQDLVLQADFLLLQLEIPMETVLAAATLAKRNGKTVILDPAPARDLPPELYALVDILTPNETEAALLAGVDTSSEAGILRAVKVLNQRGVATVIVKAGASGAYVGNAQGNFRVPGFVVTAVDTVAAGDSFNAGLAVGLSEGRPLRDACRFANAVAALATTREGAQNAMPTKAEALRLYQSQPL